MTQVARESGLSRDSLYKAMSGESSPSFDTILKVVSILGRKWRASVRNEAEVPLALPARKAKGRHCCLWRCDTFEQAPGVDRQQASLLR
jgi:transcriptional regulator with XRE-family HTH domain